MNVLFWLLVGHAVADFWAQSDWLANAKRRPHPFWPYALTAHALMHGAAVALATGYVSLGIAETVCHWHIDFGKCEGWYGIHFDQAAHIVCKVAWFLIVIYAIY